MAPEFQMKVSASAGAIHVRMKGMISERVELDTSQIPPGQPVVIDTGDVNHMNSLGVRNWIIFLDEVCARSPNVVLERLSSMMVFQASMISTFLSRAHVSSYLSPWICEECDHYVVQAHSLQDELPTGFRCPKCKNGVMELDSDADAYQTFRQMALQAR